jgi:branched-chain amino acid transport system permease protein
MVVSGIILFGLSRSAIGLILQASGQDAIEAAALGFNVTKHKLAAFCISAFFSGLAGAMLVFYMGTASVGTVIDIASACRSSSPAVLGGRRTILGAALGAIFLICRRGAAPARSAQHLRRLGNRAGGDPVLSRRLARPRAARGWRAR